jgi:hypothetical protein
MLSLFFFIEGRDRKPPLSLRKTIQVGMRMYLPEWSGWQLNWMECSFEIVGRPVAVEQELLQHTFSKQLAWGARKRLFLLSRLPFVSRSPRQHFMAK